MDNEVSVLKDLKRQAKYEFRELEGVEGFGIGDRHLVAYVRDHDSAQRLPRQFKGVDLEAVVTGGVLAQKTE